VELTDLQYREFVANRLKLPKGKRSEYIAQVDTLIERFTKVASEALDIGVRRFRKTGSLWKGTVLRPRDGVNPDADVAVYIDVAQTDDLDDLHGRIRRLLIKAYPTKNPDDFTVQPRTLGIVFVGSGLSVDLVPVIPVDEKDDYGHQPSSKGQPFTLTSVPGQLAFINSHKSAYGDWRALVRLLKRWRNQQELSQLRSFTIELIVSYLQDRHGVPPSIQDGLSRFWLFLARDLTTTVVFFSAAQGGKGPGDYETSPVVVIDPVNASNNVSVRITKAEAAAIAEAAHEAWERLSEAGTTATRSGTLVHLRAVFGNDFDFDFDFE
jgi:tRNA nucleotidyltransferase (CCA-adding enzyme)